VSEVRKAGRGCSVAVEATYGWYWAVDALAAAKFDVHLAHPYGMKALQTPAGEERRPRRLRAGQAAAARFPAGGLQLTARAAAAACPMRRGPTTSSDSRPNYGIKCAPGGTPVG